jgi:hypothetical protein
MLKAGMIALTCALVVGVLAYNRQAVALEAARATLAGKAPFSSEMGKWKPTREGHCSKARHDSYRKIGSDGKVYPISHPVVDTVDGKPCGYEHVHDDDIEFEVWAEPRRVADRSLYDQP